MKLKFIPVFISILLVFAVIPSVSAHENVDYEFLIGTGFLEQFGKVISMAPNGDTIELLGSGMLSIKPKKISGNGTVIHRDKNNNTIGTGVWHAVKLISFKPYGSGSEQGLPEEFEGGRALIKVRILATSGPDAGQSFDGTMRIDCTLGDKIPKKAMEGIRLAIRSAKLNFNKEVSGATLFIRKTNHDEEGE